MTEQEKTSANVAGEYNFAEIESKWQRYWLKNKTFKTTELPGKPKSYILGMFPYPSGDGLHVGHPEGYTATDIVARYRRMKGFNVLHPMGFDAFGLPAEQHAIATKTHPKITTEKNVNRFREQLQSLGFSYDWDREVNTTSEDYYKWTQWIFLKLFEKGLAYQSYEPVNWCPALGTVLANEEVIDGKSERGNHPVEKRQMRQWVLKITAYAERLLQDLELLDWSDSIKEMQRNWIGKSCGAIINFKIKEHPDQTFEVFTTRSDTLFGATFCVLAPEHPLVQKITKKDLKAAVDSYVEEAKNRSDMDRTALNKEKTGLFIGSHAVNPANGAELPIFIADYVMMSYGKGAIMAVPGHDSRDHEFARKHNIPIIRVLTGGEEEDITKAPHEGEGTHVNSGFLDGLSKEDAIHRMNEWLVKNKLGKEAITYKLRDWLFSRQRYWGEPFPLVRDKDGNVFAVPESELPVRLPNLEDYKPSPDGDPPLSRAKDWLQYKSSKDGKMYQRETNTMPQWAGSCWYYLRYIDPHNKNAFIDKEKERYWMPVDLYIGGAEHAVLHLLYARFWHKVLYDCGLVSTKEPFQKLVNQGMILGENNEKMSKSRGNVINPDKVVAEWGADSLRLYEMFMGPLEATKPWQTNGIVGCHRFLKRIWRIVVGDDGSISNMVHDRDDSEELKKMLHKTIKKVTEDVDNLRFNTGIAQMMEFINSIYRDNSVSRSAMKTFSLILAPYAPHISEEIWSRLGGKKTLAYEPWPTFDPALVAEDLVTMSIQVNGKLRGTIDVPKADAKDAVLTKAKTLESVARHLEGKTIVKEIFVPGKIVNFVVK